jgi:hypothetical protein
MILQINVALALHRAVNHVVEILSRLVVRRDDERRVRVFDVLIRDGGKALLARPDFMDAALLIKPFDGTLHVSTRQLFNDRLQLWISLTHDLVKMRRADPCFLELVIRPTSVDGFMLADVADEQHAILWAETPQKLVYLFRARQARFVEYEEPLLITRLCFLLAARQMALQRARLDARLGQLVGRV